MALDSFREFYRKAKITIIDNGSKDNSKENIENIRKSSPENINTLMLEKNIYHGPAMNYALNTLKEEIVFFLDSDTETKQGGFLEMMMSELESSEKNYGIGQHITVNKRGFLTEKGIIILAPAYMMLKRSLYLNFPAFEHHGQPVMKNFIAAQQRGFILKSFPIENFIEHRWRGTASRFGYGLGWSGKVDFVLNKLGI